MNLLTINTSIASQLTLLPCNAIVRLVSSGVTASHAEVGLKFCLILASLLTLPPTISPAHENSSLVMKASFAFSNLCGTVYRQGNVILSDAAEGTLLLSPVGNRLSVFNLSTNHATTLPFQMRKPIRRIALDPKHGDIVLAVDEDGHALLANIRARVTLAHINFKAPVRDAQFSPNGKFIAITHGNKVQVWRTPNALARDFSPFVLHQTYTGHFADVLSISWCKDGK